MNSVNLTDNFLIAMPNLEDMYFSHALVYICEHTLNGALGIIVNRPIDMNLAGLFDKIDVNGEVGLTSSRDVLASVGSVGLPSEIIVTLGYSGWEAGQLEDELAQNSWLTVPAKSSILFDLPPEERLPAAMQKLGISFAQLSGVAGHA